MRNPHTALRTFLLVPAVALLLSACSTPTAQDVPAEQTETFPLAVLDETITGLLPLAPHDVELRMVAPNGSELRVSGYLELGEAADGSECRADLRVVQDIKGDNASLTEITIRRDGPTTWHRLDNTTTELPVDVTNSWVDSIDFNAVRPALIFAPLFVTDGMPVTPGGGSGICTLRFLDQTAAIDPESGKVVYDMKRVGLYMNRAFEYFTEQFLRAGGAGDAEIADFVPQLVERGTPDYAEMITALAMKLKRDGDKISLSQVFDAEGFELEATFVPTSARPVERVEGISFYERLDKDPVHDQTIMELLREGVEAWLQAQGS
jgi:hypothetical protein